MSAEDSEKDPSHVQRHFFDSFEKSSILQEHIDEQSESSANPTYRFDAVLDRRSDFRSEYPQTTVYCSEQFLQAISDSVAVLTEESKGDVTKHSVDRPLLADPAALSNILAHRPTYGIGLVEHTLGEYAAELEPYAPKDFQEFPPGLSAEIIPDPSLREWALKLNSLWKSLSLKYRENVAKNAKQYSCIYLEHPIVVPGGRFRELYYWDTYWVILGLLDCNMYTTVRGLILNFVSLVEKFGFIPNANRVYYLNRSQPPMLSEMVRAYVERTEDTDILDAVCDALDLEHAFWMHRRGVELKDPATGKAYRLNRYYADVEGPRPESYIDDLKAVAGLSEERKKALFREMAACCESGWDFSSRWFGDKKSLATAYISELIPVDLNCILYRMERNLATFHGRRKVPNGEKIKYYEAAAAIRKEAVEKFLWSPEHHMWLDYHHTKNRQVGIDRMYPSNFMGLWAGLFNQDDEIEKEQIVRALLHSGLVAKTGVVTSTVDTGQQWDWPNCWSPVQYFINEGLERVGSPEALRLAQDLAMKWLLTNLVGFSKKVDGPNGPEISYAMHEKYHCSLVGERGAGGEYEPQLGFGWSNGYVLHLLCRHGALLSEVFPKLLDDSKLAERQEFPSLSAPLWQNIISSSSGNDGRRVKGEQLSRSPFVEESVEENMKRSLVELAKCAPEGQERRKFQRHMAVFQSLFRRYRSGAAPDSIAWKMVRPPKGIYQYKKICGDTYTHPESVENSADTTDDDLLRSQSYMMLSSIAEQPACAGSENYELYRSLLRKLVVLKLNGGLGTSMGVHSPKCAIEISTDREGLTILDVVVRQIKSLNEKYDVDIPLVLMNSFYTHEETQRITRRYQETVRICLFQQKKCPRIFKDTLEPVATSISFEDKRNWYPPGHGDLYDSFVNSDVFAMLKSEGKEWLFVSNIDNVGATVDLNILKWLEGHTDGHGPGTVDFCMEVTERLPSDVKIGTLASYGDRYKLVEMSQVEAMNNPLYTETFRSIRKFRNMNTNNLWMKLGAMEAVLPILSLEIAVREVQWGANDQRRRKVIQLETQCGTAIEHFERAVPINVPRSRYVPIKTTADLMVLRSKIFSITSAGDLRVSTRRFNRIGERGVITPTIRFGPEFERLDDYEMRVPDTPDLEALEHLTVVGDVTFGSGVVLKGNVVIIAEEGKVLDIPNNAVLEDKVVTGSMRIRDH